MSQAYRYLADYHWQKRELDDAYAAAQKCAEYTEVGVSDKNSENLCTFTIELKYHDLFQTHGFVAELKTKKNVLTQAEFQEKSGKS